MSGQGFAVVQAAGLRRWASFVKFSHTVFALPFALAMLLVVNRNFPVTGKQCLWILLALVAARSAAMACNRLVDRRIDSLNPRTAGRELPRGAIAPAEARVFLLLNALLFFAAAAFLGLHCLVMAPLVLALLCFYSWTKRFTSYSHLVLGAALALAPGGVWYALTARFALLPVWMMLGVAFWVAGFDILYSCQDRDFDRRQGLRSLPALWGIRVALRIARMLHVAAVLMLAVFGALAGLSDFYFAALAIFAIVLASQHLLVQADDLSRINAAFFTRNGAASVLYLIAVWIG